LGYGQRARQLESIFAGTNAAEAAPLLARLKLRRPGDKVAMFFHAHLSTATRNKLLGILSDSVGKS